MDHKNEVNEVNRPLNPPMIQNEGDVLINTPPLDRIN